MVAGTVPLRPQEKGAHAFRRASPCQNPSLGVCPAPPGGPVKGSTWTGGHVSGSVAGAGVGWWPAGDTRPLTLCGTQVWRPLWVPWWPYEQGWMACGAVEPAGLEVDASLHSTELTNAVALQAR